MTTYNETFFCKQEQYGDGSSILYYSRTVFHSTPSLPPGPGEHPVLSGRVSVRECMLFLLYVTCSDSGTFSAQNTVPLNQWVKAARKPHGSHVSRSPGMHGRRKPAYTDGGAGPSSAKGARSSGASHSADSTTLSLPPIPLSRDSRSGQYYFADDNQQSHWAGDLYRDPETNQPCILVNGAPRRVTFGGG